MGDARIRLATPETTVSRVFPADATVEEVAETMLSPEQRKMVQEGLVCLWDCTSHPPSLMKEWEASQTTLYDAGWFPSAFWKLLPAGLSPYGNIDESETEALSNPPSSSVHWNDDASAKPSAILSSVEHRFDNDVDDTERAKQRRRENQISALQRLEARHAQIEKRMHALESNTKPVALQVRKMLLKSRATGRESLRMEDRVYLECILENGSVDYRFFSKQDTVSRVLATWEGANELLVACKDDGMHRSLPRLWRLYEAEEFLKDARVVVSTEEEATPSVVRETTSEENDETGGHEVDSQTAGPVSNEPSTNTALYDNPTLLVTAEKLWKITAKSSKSSVEKVRQMKLKSQAKGDAKRVQNRFFLDVIVDGKLNPLFADEQDSLDRVAKDTFGNEPGVWIRYHEGQLERIQRTDLPVKDALHNFDRLLFLLNQ